MKNLFLFLIPLSTALIFSSCGSSSQQEGEEAQTDEQMSEETQQPVVLSAAPNSPEYMDAILQLNSPTEGEQLSSSDSVSFAFTVTNYELGIQTPDATEKPLANSGNGQHIHLILNNEPYSAHYEPEFNKAMEDGHYVALAFLSRSYHESVKNPEAYSLIQFNVGEGEGEDIDVTAPHMFYSRPKGTYSGADTEKLLLDFYLVNTDLGDTGNSVRVTVNGDTEFTITEWKPYVLENLPMGENTIKLELLDSSGNLIDSPYNPVERTVTLEEGNVPS